MTPLLDKAIQGDRLSLARLLSKIESRSAESRKLLQELFPRTGKAHLIGITGPPGAGKSTLTDRLLTQLRQKGDRVAVVAVDPTSPFTGGAILGDRIRMQDHTSDDGVYIRSLGSRGRKGGVSHATREIVWALDAVGFDTIIIETVGVGQNELDIMKLAHTVLVVLVPESGDSIQVLKAGLMEIADLFAVNKSDRPEADKLARELVQLIGMRETSSGLWEIPVIKTEAIQNTGVAELTDALHKHRTFLIDSGLKEARVKEFFKEEVTDILIEELKQSIQVLFETLSGKELIQSLADRKIDPYSAAKQIQNT